MVTKSPPACWHLTLASAQVQSQLSPLAYLAPLKSFQSMATVVVVVVVVVDVVVVEVVVNGVVSVAVTGSPTNSKPESQV